MDATASKCQVSSEGPARSLLDHGAQETLARQKFLSKVRQKLGWSKEQCHAHDLPLDVQPIGVSGRPLRATVLVSLIIEVEETGASELLIPCYV